MEGGKEGGREGGREGVFFTVCERAWEQGSYTTTSVVAIPYMVDYCSISVVSCSCVCKFNIPHTI